MKHDKELLYTFTPAAFISNFVPLVIILHNEEEVEITSFEYKMWNVLNIQESIDEKNRDALQELIEKTADEYECEEHIYFYGSDKQGYEVILHGVLSKANAVYAYNPKIKLAQNDLTYLLNSATAFPILYLCNSEESAEVDAFVEVCRKRDVKINLEHCPKLEYDETKNLKEVLDFFERMVSQV
ncbi:MAG: hypothetical protein U9Q40_10935 [Campylobacterota bacterium]|nr:hypothetical protein [Campylobacterota bacterium]